MQITGTITHAREQSERSTAEVTTTEIILFGIVPLCIFGIFFLFSGYRIVRYVQKNLFIALNISIGIGLCVAILYLFIDQEVFIFGILPLVGLGIISISCIYIVLRATKKITRSIKGNKKKISLVVILVSIVLLYTTAFMGYHKVRGDQEGLLQGFFKDIPEVTGFTVEQIYEFIIPRNESTQFSLPEEAPLFNIGPVNKTEPVKEKNQTETFSGIYV